MEYFFEPMAALVSVGALGLTPVDSSSLLRVKISTTFVRKCSRGNEEQFNIPVIEIFRKTNDLFAGRAR